MKIKEAIKIINSTKTAVACLWKEKIYFYANDGVDKFDWFLMMPPKADKWDDVKENFEALYSITPKDLARVMDVIQRLLDTPVNERFPESKYTVQVLADYDESFLNVGKDDGFAFFEDEVEAGPVQTQFTQAEIDELKQRPDLAIDWDKAIIKGVKNDED